MGKPKEASHDPLVQLCRSLPGATEDVKWGDDLVFSVGGKMFAALLLPDLETLSLKVEPPLFAVLIRQSGIEPSPYLGRHGWIRIERGAALSEDRTKELIRESHALVASKLPKRVQRELGLA